MNASIVSLEDEWWSIELVAVCVFSVLVKNVFMHARCSEVNESFEIQN